MQHEMPGTHQMWKAAEEMADRSAWCIHLSTTSSADFHISSVAGISGFIRFQVYTHHPKAMLLQALSKPAGQAASFSASPAQASQQPDSPSVSALKQSMIRVQPHALENHVPALCGPLQASHHSALKHLHNVEARFYCPHTFLSLDFRCRDDVSALE